MPTTSPRLGLKAPTLGELPDGPLAFKTYLVDILDPQVAIDGQGILADRPVSTPGSPGKVGRYYMVHGDPDGSQNGFLYRDFGTGWDRIPPEALGQALLRKPTPTTITGITEQDLLNNEWTILGGLLGTNKVFRTVGWGSYKQNSGGDVNIPIFRLKYGAVTLIATSTFGDAEGTSANVRHFQFGFEIANKDATHQIGRFHAELGTATSDFSTGRGTIVHVGGDAMITYDGSSAGSVSVDSTADQPVHLTAQLASSSGNVQLVLDYAYAVIE